MSEWSFVKTKRKERNNKNVGTRFRGSRAKEFIEANQGPDLTSAELIVIVDKIMSTVDKLRTHHTEFCKRITQAYQQFDGNTDLENRNNLDLICYGIGNISCSPSALLQFSLAVLLKQDLVVDYCECFDPMFTDNDKRICSELGFTSNVTNCHGKHCARRKCIYYMPHCPYRLYCNILWANREALAGIFIIGNSFDSYLLRRFEDESSNTDCVRQVACITREVPVWVESEGSKGNTENLLLQFENAFNDLGAMHFSGTLEGYIWPSEESIDEATSQDVEVF